MAQRTARLTEEQRRFLDENAYVGVVTTLREDGSPHSTPVWVDVLEDGTPSFNTATGRAKPRHIEHDPRVSLVVVSPEDPYKWVSISGEAEMTLEGADAQIDKLAKKYIGEDEYPWRNPDEQRLSVRIRPAQVDSSGLGS
jgi:PPOX class probable F420-dependent enzyme